MRRFLSYIFLAVFSIFVPIVATNAIRRVRYPARQESAVGALPAPVLINMEEGIARRISFDVVEFYGKDTTVGRNLSIDRKTIEAINTLYELHEVNFSHTNIDDDLVARLQQNSLRRLALTGSLVAPRGLWSLARRFSHVRIDIDESVDLSQELVEAFGKQGIAVVSHE